MGWFWYQNFLISYKWQILYIHSYHYVSIKFFKSWPKVVIEVALFEFRTYKCEYLFANSREIVNILEIKTSQLKEKINVFYIYAQHEFS